MSDATQMQQAYDTLLGSFLLPLLEGGLITTTKPIGPGCASYFAQTRSGSIDTDRRIFDALHRGASAIANLETLQWPSMPILAMSAAMYNLLCATDPAYDRLFARNARKTIRTWSEGWLSLVGTPRSRGDALARHVLVERFVSLKREDLVLRSWAYTYRFHGRQPNIVTVPGFGFDNPEKHDRNLDQILVHTSTTGTGFHLSDLADAITRRSPLTELLRIGRGEGAFSQQQSAPFSFSLATLTTLADRALRSAVAGRLLVQESASASLLGHAIFQPDLLANPSLLAIAIQLVLEMHIMGALDRRSTPMRDGGDLGFARYAAVLIASLDDDRAVRELETFDDGHRALVQKRAEGLRPRVPRDVLLEMRGHLQRALEHEPEFLPH